MDEKEFIMSGTFILALVGAAAWLPHIITWLYNYFAKPSLRFVPEPISEIGYHKYGGPIFNQTFSISTSKKDALIEKVSLDIVHESGEKHSFNWKSLDEKGFEMTSISGERTELHKHQLAIALKVSLIGLVEKKIFFQDFDFLESYNSILRRLIEKEHHLKKTAKDRLEEETFKSKEFQDLLDAFKTGFYWRKGKYDVTLYAFEVSLKEPHIEHFKFELSKVQSEQLEKNIELIYEELRIHVKYSEVPFKEWPPKPSWYWVNPTFCRADK